MTTAIRFRYLNAQHIRKMPDTQFVNLSIALGLQVAYPITPESRDIFIEKTADVRRSLASKRGWDHRK